MYFILDVFSVNFLSVNWLWPFVACQENKIENPWMIDYDYF